MKSCLLRVLTFGAALASGCGNNPYFSDDEGGTRASRSVTGDHPDELSLPYALGTEVNVAVKGLPADFAGWQVVSDTPGVLTIMELTAKDKVVTARCQAMGEGTARLRLIDPAGKEQRIAPVNVRAPDRVRIFAHGSLRIVGRDEATVSQAEITDAHVVVGGKAVFALAYYRAAERLYGRGIVEVGNVPMITTDNPTSEGVVTNEWLVVTPEAPGVYPLELRHRGALLGTLPITGVAESELAGLSLAEELKTKKNGEEVWVLARVRDTAGKEVLGVYHDWTLDGVAQLGKDQDPMTQRGDLYRYKHADGRVRKLVATRGALTASLDVSADEGYVSSTTYLGCSAAPGRARAPDTLVALFVLVPFGLVLGRRRRPLV